MDGNGKLPAEAIYTTPNGRVRAYYRTVETADDALERAIVVSECAAENEGRTKAPLRAILRFALSTFCTRIELLDESGNVTATHGFTLDLLKELTGPYAEGGWPADLALLIYREVVDSSAKVIDDGKKASESTSGQSTQEKASTEMLSESPRT